MFNEDLKYLSRSTLITLLPVFLIIIITEYVLGFVLSKSVVIDYIDVTARSMFFSQTIGIFNLLKYQKGTKRRDEFEKVETLRIVALNVILYLVGVIIATFILTFIANYITNANKDLNYISMKIITNIVFLAIIALYKLKVAKDIISK